MLQFNMRNLNLSILSWTQSLLKKNVHQYALVTSDMLRRGLNFKFKFFVVKSC